MTFRWRLWLLVLGLMVIGVSVPAREYRIPGDVTDATVYRDQATVRKVVRQVVPDGQHTFKISLPDRVNEERLRVYSDDNTTIRTFRTETRHLSRISDTRVRHLKQTIERLETEKKLKQATADANQQRLDFLKDFRTTYNDKLAREQLAQDFSSEELGSLTRFLVEDFQEAKRATIMADSSIESLQQEIEATRKELDKLRGQSDRVRKSAVVEISRVSDGKSSLELVYGVPTAGWTASYSLRARPDANELFLELFGRVKQTTGEAWEDVDLKLSTGRPASGATLSLPDPLLLDPPESEPRGAGEGVRLKQSTASRALTSNGSRAEANKPEVSGPPEKGPNVTFPARQLSSLPADGTARRIRVIGETVPAQFSYRAVPIRTEDVFLWVEAENTLDYPLPGGEGDVYVDDGYVGKLNLQNILVGDTIAVSAGVDQRLTAGREKVVTMRDSTYWSERARITLEYRITVQNGRSTPAEVTVVDRVPVPQHEKISVNVKNITKPNRQNDDGLVFWNRSIPASGQKQFSLSYTVAVPPKWKSILPD